MDNQTISSYNVGFDSAVRIFVTSQSKCLESHKISSNAIVTLADDGTLTISGNLPVSGVTVVFSKPFSKNAAILSDAFERGYGDLGFTLDRHDRMPWYFIANDCGNYYAYGVETCPNALCFWQCTEHGIELYCDLRAGTDELQLNGKLNIARIITASGTGDIYSFCRKFCIDMSKNPRIPAHPIFGGNDWYCNYGNNSQKQIIELSEFISDCAAGLSHKPYVVIDDGWQIERNKYAGYNGGPWEAGKNFGCMKQTAEKMKKLGVIPGIWLRPLITLEKLPQSCFLDYNNHILDPSDHEALSHVASDIRKIVSWGFELIKFDFVTFDIFGKWGFEMSDNLYANELHFKDCTKTTAQVIKNFYGTIREAAQNVILLGCNAIGHLAVGYIDVQRTGDDTSGREWERTRKMGINTLAFRMMQHNTFFACDADCVGFTKHIPIELNKKWLDVLAKSGTALFVSVAEECRTKSISDAIRIAFAMSNKAPCPSLPLDFRDTLCPSVWQSDFGVDIYNWNNELKS